ncbi:hypothetical protein FHR56_003728 [Xanthomonas sacchari]|uniref:hypothetical protein n=1 Tax=Xanthomonas sp. F10 TaxID=3035309 RepID=UPI00161DB8FD|nr:hypothetical protein [Xanthomonas sp. F10]MBB6368549.1 hypothetical protein [Xanthomonas sp. F10]
MSKYTFEITHFLSDREVAELEAECAPSFQMLNRRYMPDVDLSQGYTPEPEYLDLVRTSWLVDEESDRPEHTALVEGLGFAFGKLLQQRTALRWCVARDSDGAFLTMGRMDENPAKVSVPVFSYVEKREKLMNGEVFSDFFKQLSPDVLGA